MLNFYFFLGTHSCDDAFYCSSKGAKALNNIQASST